MSVKTTPELAKLFDLTSKLNAEDMTEVTVAMLLSWEAQHPEVDTMSDVVINVVRAMVIDAGGEVHVHEIDDDEWGDWYGAEWFDDTDD